MVSLAKNFSRFPPESWLGGGCGLDCQPSKAVISRAAVICITLGCITLLSIVVVAVYRCSNPQQFSRGTNAAVQVRSSEVGHIAHGHGNSYNEDITRITENLNEKLLDIVPPSTVYKCILKNSKPIAIKRIYSQYPHNLWEFEDELATIGNIKHRNLVCLHGYSLTPHGNLLFYDYMENGSLWDLHGSSRKVKLDWDTRLRIVVGAAQGLAYLHHDCNPRIIHRDVKTSNILLDENFEAHLSDFGIAKCVSSTKTHASTYVMGTIGYIEPEYARTSRLNEKYDVYSFGIILLELLTGKKAVDNESNLHQLILSKADDNTVMEAVHSEVSVTCTDMRLVGKMFQLALLCMRHPTVGGTFIPRSL